MKRLQNWDDGEKNGWKDDVGKNEKNEKVKEAKALEERKRIANELRER